MFRQRFKPQSCTLPIWHPSLFYHVQVLNVSHKGFQEIRRNEHVCTANKLSEARPASGAVTKSGPGLGCIAFGKNSFGGWWWPWMATGCLSSGPRTLGSPRIQGPNKAYSSAVIVTSPDYRREPAGYADVKQTHHKMYTDGQ